MLKEIKIIDGDEREITPTQKLVALPDGNGSFKFITKEEAEFLLRFPGAELNEDVKRIIQGQLNIMEAQKIVNKERGRKRETNINRKTGCTVRGNQ